MAGCAAIPVEIGALPLPRDLLVKALNTQALTLLCPPPVGGPLSISFQALQSAPGEPLVPHTLRPEMWTACTVPEIFMAHSCARSTDAEDQRPSRGV